MAVLWQRQSDDTLYQVRSAGATRRLYENGILHTQYNPNKILTGSVWDLLTLPAFFFPTPPRRVLLLGVGGGAVIRQLRHFFPDITIDAVELNPLYIQLGRKYFGLGDERLHLDDAVAWLKEYDGEKFDLIIDDLFAEVDGEPRRAVALHGPWFKTLLKQLKPGGALVANCADAGELRECAWFSHKSLRKPIKSAFRLMHPRCENAVGVFLKFEARSMGLRKRLPMAVDYSIRRLMVSNIGSSSP